MPEIMVGQIVCAGVTTVVGLLGTDTMTRNMGCLHAKASQLWAEGITTYIYTGGFELPPTTLTGSVVDDVVMIDKIIGTGEIAISDSRWLDPQLYDLAHIVSQTALGGQMAGKAGVTHFHTGAGKRRLALLHELLDCFDVPPSSIYPDPRQPHRGPGGRRHRPGTARSLRGHGHGGRRRRGAAALLPGAGRAGGSHHDLVGRPYAQRQHAEAVRTVCRLCA